MGDESARTCVLCGALAPRPGHGGDSSSVSRCLSQSESQSSWTTEVDPRRGTLLICPDCTREHVRSIEARLDQEWW